MTRRREVFGWIAAAALAGCGATGAEPAPPPSLPAAPSAARSSTPRARALPEAGITRDAVARSVATFNLHDPSGMAAAYSVDAIVTTPGPGGIEEERGRDPIVKGHEGLFGAFPDIRMVSRRVLVRGREFVHEWASAGTHRRTGKRIGIDAVTAGEVAEDGLIRVDHTYFDAITMDVQKGDRPGAARPIPELEGSAEIVIAEGSPEEDRPAEVARAFYAALEGPASGRDLSLLAEGAVRSDVSSPGDITGRDAIGAELALFEGRHTPRRVLGAGRFVAAEITFSGTHRPSGRLVELHRIEVIELGPGGKIVRQRVYASRLELMGQLGQL